jgi:hypothetical protein
LGQFSEALFVLANGPKAVVAFADIFRHQRTLQAWRKDAASSQHIAQACLEAERKAAAALQTWDAAVLTWGARHVRLENDATLDTSLADFEEWVAAGLDGFRLFPDVQREETAHKRSPFGLLPRLRRGLSRALVRCALALHPTRRAGNCR